MINVNTSNQFFSIPSKVCKLLGQSFGDRFSLRISLVLMLIGISGLYVEIINAFEYVQGARKRAINFLKLIISF